MNLTNNQKREYLELLFSEGKEVALQFINRIIQKAWLEALPLETKLSILSFLTSFGEGHKIPVEGYSIIKKCASCYSGDDFGRCLEEGRVKLQNPTLKHG